MDVWELIRHNININKFLSIPATKEFTILTHAGRHGYNVLPHMAPANFTQLLLDSWYFVASMVPTLVIIRYDMCDIIGVEY